MRRGDVAVMSISAALAAVVVAAVTYSVTSLDKTPNPSALLSDDASSWLVLTWAPSFCTAEPENAACGSGEVAPMGQTLILHGLWPQPRDRQYCNVPQEFRDRESALPPVQVSDRVREGLASKTVNTGSLMQHEWYTHGTCAGVSPDTYFGDAVTLTDEARTVLDPVLRDAAGGRVTLAAVRGRVDEAFGAGAGERVGLGCQTVSGEGAVVVEVRLSLPPVVSLRDTDGTASLGKLLEDAPPMPVQCRHGSVP
ncbi:ribonuclease T2 family protein [Mycolicibacterium monacense]|uniref:ribonuclease T2 family protein n=1 Tax=Mycolicibacterium monacense TaxID=85693 RepID=UPI0007E94A72|nr:ribonuclease T(2) [Mycolicibacterium monacense]OBF48900.1 ribonuclease T(2) [Mycolicibacterium monacense]